jgi:light-regulated signal transduction histidine kinase (bacteriophytochrome)
MDIEVRSTPVLYQGRSLFQSVARDITKRKRAEAELRQRTAELARSNAELEHFAYVASHDLHEPLRMVSSFMQLLARRYQGQLDATAHEYIAFAIDGANRMKTLINDLLVYSRVGTKGKPLKPTDCAMVLEQVLASLQLAIQENEATVTYGSLPTVLADETQLGQLFQNLLGNALKFRSAAPPRIHISARLTSDFLLPGINSVIERPPASRLDLPSKAWLFSVQDNGIGLEPQFAERIFIIFQRLTTKSEYPGTGIGLAICKKIVERHGGRIWVESEPGQGATFYFILPNSDPNAATLTADH